MTSDAAATSRQFHARLAGIAYLVSMFLYVAPLAIIGSLDVPGDFARTAQNVAASEPLVRLVLASLVLGFLTIIVLAWAFYVLLKPVNPGVALFALLCRAVEAGLMAISTIGWFAALANYTATSDAGGRQMLDKLLTSGINTSFHIAMICSSIGSILFFYLLFRSRYIPRPLAGFDMAASALALAFAFALLLAPRQLGDFGMAGWGPIFLAEIATGLWLAIKGVRSEAIT